MTNGVYTDTVQKLYIAYFNRPGEPTGIATWEAHLAANGGDVAAISAAFSASDEYKKLYEGMNTDQLINELYLNLFGREAEPAGLLHWSLRMAQGLETISSIALALVNGAQGTDADAITAKIAAANAFTLGLDTTPEIVGYSGYEANEVARQWLKNVTDNESLADAMASVDDTTADAVAARDAVVNAGGTFNLTTGQDGFTGTAKNDTFNAATVNVLGQDANTLQGFDSMDGGAGIDTLNIYVKDDDNGNVFNQAAVGTINNVEIVNIYNTEALDKPFGSNTDAINAAKFGGVQQLWQIDDAYHVENVAADVKLGFRNIDFDDSNTYAGEDDIDLTAAAGVSALTIKLDGATGEDADFDVQGSALNTLNISGDLTYDDEDSCGNPTIENGEVDVDVDGGTGTAFKLNSSMNVDLDIYASNFTEVNASESTGDIEVWGNWDQLQTVLTGSGDDYVDETGFVTTATKAATYHTGAGEDGVELSTDGVGKTEVKTGDHDDWIDVNDASKTLVIDAGAGDDELYFVSGFQTAGTDTTKITANMGEGDDAVIFDNLIMADVPASWVLDGGAGDDTVALGAGIGREFTAGDYVTLTESLKNFESLELYAGEGEAFTVDASRLSGYKEIDFWGEDSDITVTKAAADQTIGIETWFDYGGSTLRVTAAGYDAAATPKAYGGEVNVAVDSTYSQVHVSAKASALNLTVDTDWIFGGAATVGGDIKTLNATLNAEVITNDADCPEDLEDIGTEGVLLFVNTAGFTSALTSVNLAGVGEAMVSNVRSSKLAMTDASELTNIAWDSEDGEVIVGNALDYFTSNDLVAETIKLGAGIDEVGFGFYDEPVVAATSTTPGDTGLGDRWASSYSKMDKVTGLNLVGTTANAAVLDTAKSDSISVDTTLAGSGGFVILSVTEAAAVSNAASFSLALQAVAQNTTKDLVAFQYSGNTYLFGDTGGVAANGDLVTVANDQLDDSDMVIQLTGTVGLDLLLQSLNATV